MPRIEISPEEWQAMLEWLKPRISVGLHDGPYDVSVCAERYVDIMLERLNARHLTEFKAQWLVSKLKSLSKTPASFRKNLEALVSYRLNELGRGAGQSGSNSES